MTKAQAIEFIQQASPSTGETEIGILLDNAVREFTVATELLSDIDTVTTQASVYYYPLSLFSNVASANDVIRIKRVDYEGDIMDALSGEIKDDDFTEAV